MYWFPAGHLEISSPCLYFSTGLLQTLACRYRWLPYSLPSSNRKMMRPITGATYKKVHSSLVWMGVQFWPSVSFTYYNQSLAYANHNPEPCPGTSKRCWMILCRCCYHWLCSECRLLLQAVAWAGWLQLGSRRSLLVSLQEGLLNQVQLQAETFWRKACCMRAKHISEDDS